MIETVKKEGKGWVISVEHKGNKVEYFTKDKEFRYSKKEIMEAFNRIYKK